MYNANLERCRSVRPTTGDIGAGHINGRVSHKLTMNANIKL